MLICLRSLLILLNTKNHILIWCQNKNLMEKNKYRKTMQMSHSNSSLSYTSSLRHGQLISHIDFPAPNLTHSDKVLRIWQEKTLFLSGFYVNLLQFLVIRHNFLMNCLYFVTYMGALAFRIRVKKKKKVVKRFLVSILHMKILNLTSRHSRLKLVFRKYALC